MELSYSSQRMFNFLLYGLLLLSFLSYEYTLYYTAYQHVLVSILLLGSVLILFGIGHSCIWSLYYEILQKNKIVYIFSLALLISFAVSSFEYNYSSLRDFIRIITLIVSIYFFYLFLPVLIEDMEKLIKYLILMITFFSIISILIGITGSFLIYTPTHFPRISSIFFDPNYFGVICSIGFVLAIQRNFFYKLLAVVNFIALLYSGSRAAIISLAVIVLIFDFYGKKFNFKKMFVFLLIIIVSFYLYNYLQQINFFRTYHGLSGRDSLWLKSFELIKETPLWGYGPGALGTLFSNNNLTNTSSHNAYIDFVFDHGLLPFFIYIVLVIKGLYRGVINNVDPSIIKCILLLFINANSISINVGGLGATSFLLTVFLGYCNFQIINRNSIIIV